MDKIPFQTVQDSIDKICSITDENALESASQHLFEAQPDLAGFFMEFIEDMSEEAQDLGFMMALILYKSFEEQYQALRAMNEDEIVERFEKSEAEFEKYLKINDDLLADLQKKAESGGQPEVLNYIVEELFMSPELEPKLASDEQVHLFIICKFFADCLHDVAHDTTGIPPTQLRH
ncbi:MAG: hypothetical protein AAGB31_09515 [Bdellovibrio sp.]